MKFTVAVLLTIVVNFLLSLFLPWWIIAAGAGAIAYCLPQQPWKSSLTGFIGGFLHWAGFAFFIDIQNNHILATRIAGLFSVGQPIAIVLITGVIAGLVAGLAALAVAIFRHSRSEHLPAA
jgi:uncharacterized membrane protein